MRTRCLPGLVLATLFLSSFLSCVTPEAGVCSFGLVCPSNKVCDATLETCLLPEQRTACDGAADDQNCSLPEFSLGRCRDGVCYASSCGNGVIEVSEECDGPGESLDCTDLGYYEPGAVSCGADCNFDRSVCGGGICGDGIKNGPEFCDGSRPTEQCAQFGFGYGAATCHDQCGPELSQCKQLGWTEYLRTGPQTTIQDAWGSAPDDVWAVGLESCDLGYLLHFDGVDWTTEATTTGLLRLWGSRADDLWAIGRACNGDYLILQYDGSTWTESLSTATALSDIWGNAEDDIWAVGDDNTILHYDGVSWTPAIVPGFGSALLLTVWGSAANDVWAGGVSGALRHFDGITWTDESIAGTQFRSIWGTSRNDIWAVGNDSTSGNFATNGSIHHYDGNSWTVLSPSPNLPLLSTVNGSSSSDVWVVGQLGVSVHFDGVNWKRASTLNGASLGALWSSAPGDVWTMVRETGTMLRYQGATWVYETSAQSLPTPPSDLWAFATDDVWVVSRNDGFVQHYDGEIWTPTETTGFGVDDLETFWASAPDDIWLVGGNGMLHFDGSEWSNEFPLIALSGIWGIAPDDIWAVGSGGLHHYDGTIWTPEAVAPLPLRDVWGTAANDVWAVGDDGSAMHYDGSAWTTLPPFTTEPLRNLWGSGANDYWVQAGANTLFHYDGTQWTSEFSSAQPISDVFGTAADDIWAVGARDSVLHYDGTVWSPVLNDIEAAGSGYSCVMSFGSYVLAAGTSLSGDFKVDQLYRSTGFGQ